MKHYDLTLVLPCYNEAEHIEKSLPAIITKLTQLPITSEIVLVEDKSQDKTLQLIKKIIARYPEVPIRLITHRVNHGRGQAVMTGIEQSRGNWVGYIDIDIEISPGCIKNVLPMIKHYDVIVANRSYDFAWHSVHRYIASTVYRSLSHYLLGLPIHDSEAGFKFFNRQKILSVLPHTQHNGWFWDTEIIFYSHKYGLKIGEIPVRYIRNPKKSSTVNTLRDSLTYLIALTRLLTHNKLR